jgi:hypothetical protein
MTNGRWWAPVIISTAVLSGASAQREWHKHPGNPVMMKDTTLAGVWQWAGIGQPTCLFESDTFKMWYASAGVSRGPMRCGMSASRWLTTRLTVRLTLGQ